MSTDSDWGECFRESDQKSTCEIFIEAVNELTHRGFLKNTQHTRSIHNPGSTAFI